MNRPEREDRFTYTKPEEIKILTMQCERCINRLEDSMVCTEYPERKPNCVLRVECDCPKFEPKK